MAASTTSYVMPDPCDHKPITGCMLTALPCCCSCADKRPEASAYAMYIDGQGMRMKGRRWQRYCRKCYDFYESPATERQAAEASDTSTISMPVNPFAAALQRRQDVTSFDQENVTPRRERREGRVQTYPLGTVEDVQQDDYVSPITGMFTRAYDRFRIAEEVRRAEAHSAVMQAHNDENTRSRGNPFTPVQDLPSNLSLNPLANPFNPPELSGVQIQIPSLLRGPPHRPRTNFHRQFYSESSRSLPQSEPDSMDEGPNPVDLQALQRPAPSQPESLNVDFACKVCVEQRINTICEPCMHACMCQWCAAIVRNECRTEEGRFDGRLWKCPICRTRITQIRKFYIE